MVQHSTCGGCPLNAGFAGVICTARGLETSQIVRVCLLSAHTMARSVPQGENAIAAAQHTATANGHASIQLTHQPVAPSLLPKVNRANANMQQ